MDPREQVRFEPDPVWTDRYERERERIEAASGDGLLGVFHVGSTAIEGVPGKPELDVLAVYGAYEPMRAAAEDLADEGFELSTDDGECIVLSRWEDGRAVFLKLHVQGDERVRNQLLFREYLRETAEARRAYEQTKREAAAAHREDPQAYIGAKTDTVGSLLADAREAGYDEELPSFV
jgi:GrpB-like predicted nucleotidyltransferase (UPF0157 family)